MKRVFLVIVFIFCSLIIYSGFYKNETYYYSIEYSNEWYLLEDVEKYSAVFQDNDETAFFEVIVVDLEAMPTNEDLFYSFLDRFEGTGSYYNITFCNYSAVRSDVTFYFEGYKFKGDIVVVKDNYFYYVVMGYSYYDYYNSYKDSIDDIIMSFKIYYDNNIIYSNDKYEENSNDNDYSYENNTNNYYEEQEEEYEDLSGEYDELRPEWDDYSPVFKFLKKDLYKAQKEMEEIIDYGSWDYYGVDPYGSYPDEKFWEKFYQDMFKKNYYRVNDVVRWFEEKYDEEGWSAYELAENVIKSVQIIRYAHPSEVSDEVGPQKLGYFTPNEIAYYDCGDCDTKSLFAVIILERLGFDTVMYYSRAYNHAMLGININGSGYYKVYNGKKYYFIEAAGYGYEIGEISEKWTNTDNWYLIPIN